MTKEMKLKAFEMRLDGATYREIADKFGVSVESIHRTLTSEVHNRNGTRSSLNCIYPALRDWAREHQLSTIGVFREMFPDQEKNRSTNCMFSWISNRLTGKIAFTSAEWLRLAEITGLSLEQLMDSNGAIKLERRTRKGKES